MILALVLSVAPWTGASLPAATSATAKYRIALHGKPRERVTLSASGLPAGWVASFCTPTFCAPFRYDAVLDARGAAVVELALIRTDPKAARRVRVLIGAPGVAPHTIDVR